MIDGDTVRCNISLGCFVVIRDQVVRLLGINAPELHGESLLDGRTSRAWLTQQVLARTVTLRTHKDKKEKYGRWLGVLFVGDVCINDAIVAAGMAVPYMEGK